MFTFTLETLAEALLECPSLELLQVFEAKLTALLEITEPIKVPQNMWDHGLVSDAFCQVEKTDTRVAFLVINNKERDLFLPNGFGRGEKLDQVSPGLQALGFSSLVWGALVYPTRICPKGRLSCLGEMTPGHPVVSTLQLET
jgi:hypothetical protein